MTDSPTVRHARTVGVSATVAGKGGKIIMCIMEVRPGQRTATIAQAMAHNLSTVDRDFDMFRTVLRQRGDADGLARIDGAQRATHDAYADMLAMFETEVGDEYAALHRDHHGDHDHGDERAFIERVTDQARRFETR